MNLLVFLLNAEIYPCVIFTDGSIYYNDSSEVAKKYSDSFTQIAIVITNTTEEGLGLTETTKDILPEPFPLQGVCANSVM